MSGGTSARLSLRQQLDRARREAYLDLRALAFDGLFVRCRPLTKAELTAALERGDDVEGSIDVLVSTCLGIWVEQDGKGVSPVEGFGGVVDLDGGALSGELPTFASQELADELGVGQVREVGIGAVVRALLGPTTDLSVSRLGAEVVEWSSQINEKVRRDARPT